VPIRFTCSSCGKALKVAEEMAGKQGRCPFCQSTVTVPLSAPPSETEEKIEIEEREETRLFETEGTPEGLRRCPSCGILVEKSARACPRCRADLTTAQEAAKTVAPRRLPREKAALHPASFWAALPYTFAYPFNRKGIFILILGTVLILFVGIIQTILAFGGILGALAQLIVAIFTFGYIGSYMFRIIEETGGGGEQPPPLPSITDYVEDIVIPFLQLLGTLLASFVPLILYLILCVGFRIPIQGIIVLVLFIYALVSFPMGLTVMAMSGSAAALNPVLIVASILKVPLHYLGALVFLVISLALQALGLKVTLPQVPILSIILAQFISLYFLMVNMRVLGLIYRYNEEKLG